MNKKFKKNDFEIKKNQPCKRISWKVYVNNILVQTLDKKKDAIVFVDWCVKNGLSNKFLKECK